MANDFTNLEAALAGAVAGGVSTALVYPADTAITAKQTGNYEKLVKSISENFLDSEMPLRKKVAPLYAGLPEKIGKNALGMGLTLGAFNILKNFLTKEGSLKSLGFEKTQ